MYEVRTVRDAEALPFQRALSLEDCEPETGRHRLERFASRIGAFAGERLVGMVRLLPVNEDEVIDAGCRRMDGPFIQEGHGDCQAALLARVLEDLQPGTRLWKPVFDEPRPEGYVYSARDIQVLVGLEAVRRRPGMYVGGLGEEGMIEAILVPVHNTLAEHRAGHASRLHISCDDGLWTVRDDGRGIPVRRLESGESALERVMMTLSCGRRDFRSTAPPQGPGLAVLNALSAECEVEVERDGARHRQRYARGVPGSLLTEIEPLGQRGTTVRFRLDPDLFEAALAPADLRPALSALARESPGLSIRLQGEPL